MWFLIGMAGGVLAGQVIRPALRWTMKQGMKGLIVATNAADEAFNGTGLGDLYREAEREARS